MSLHKSPRKRGKGMDPVPALSSGLAAVGCAHSICNALSTCWEQESERPVILPSCIPMGFLLAIEVREEGKGQVMKQRRRGPEKRRGKER